MKKLILSVSVAFLFTGLNAQKAEMEAAVAAFNSNNYSETLNQTKKAEALLNSNREIEPGEIAKLYFNAAQAAEKSGDLVTAAAYYAKTSEIEKNAYFKARNKDTKEWEYFLTKADADRITGQGNYTAAKEENISNSLMGEVAVGLNDKANAAVKLANESFKAQKYDVAGKEFLKAYHLYKATGNDNELLKYYGALSILQTSEKQQAAELLQQLVDSGFTGVRTNYYAIDATTNQEVAFATKADMDTQVKLNLVKNPKTETTESLEEELYSNTTYAWYSVENFDNALKVGQQGLTKYPQNENMNQIVSGVYFKTGDSAKFKQNLEQKVADGSAKAVDYFNLAKTIEDAGGSLDEAVGYYKKAIEMDPQFQSAYLNLAFAIIKPEKEYVELMNANLGTSNAERKIYTENMEKRKGLYQEALPYLEKAYQLDNNSINLIRVLRNTYEVVGNDGKYFEFKEMYEQKATNQQ